MCHALDMENELFPDFEPEPQPQAAEEAKGAPRFLSPNRGQVELRALDLESLVAEDHPVRAVWSFVESLDLTAFYDKIQSVEGRAGRPATDPRIYLALWLFAIVEGVGSARALARLTEQHDAYRWICGGVTVNYHSLSDFRVEHVEILDQLLTHSVATLMSEGLVSLQRVAQDGMRIRASAGAASFRREPSLQECLKEAEEQVEALRQEMEDDPGSTTRRQAAARQRAAEDRQARVKAALEQMPDAASKKPAGKKDEARVSTTDPESRPMKMADGGFRPAYNGQFSVDTESQVITGADVSNHGSDYGKLSPLLEQHEQRYGKIPEESLVDGGYVSAAEIEKATGLGTKVYAPVAKSRNPKRDPHLPRESDSEAVAEWRQRMGTAEAKTIYRERGASVECVNAIARNRGLRLLRVRGERKVKAILLWFALAHNMMRGLSLRAALASA